MRVEKAVGALLGSGRLVFSLAIMGFGVETVVCAHSSAFISSVRSPQFRAIPILPFLPPIPCLAYLFGTLLAACGLGLLFRRTMRMSAMALGVLLVAPALLLGVPRYAAIPGSMPLRTLLLEPLAIASLAWLLPGRELTPVWLVRISHILLAISFLVFGVDHFLALASIGALIPHWIPWHVFWIAFFGAGFVAAGASIATGFFLRWGAACIGLMFAIWVFTLHIPLALGLYVIPGRSNVPSHWSSLFIATALWGGTWALARGYHALSL